MNFTELQEYHYRHVFLEIGLSDAVDLEEGAKRCKRLVTSADGANSLVCEEKCLGPSVVSTRRLVARCFLVMKSLLTFETKSYENACIHTYQLLQRFNLIKDIFRVPLVAVSIFTETKRNRILNTNSVAWDSMPRYGDVELILNENGDQPWTDEKLQQLGRALFFETHANEQYSGINFQTLMKFHSKLITLLNFFKDQNVVERLRQLYASDTIPPLNVGDLDPQSIVILIDKGQVLNGAHLLAGELLSNMNVVLERMNGMETLHHGYANLDLEEEVDRGDDMQGFTVNRNRDRVQEVSRHATNRQCDALRSHIGEVDEGLIPVNTVPRSITQDINQKIPNPTSVSWTSIHPLAHPVGLRMVFVYLYIELYEDTYFQEPFVDVLSWIHRMPEESRHVLSNWLTTHIPLSMIQNHCDLMHSFINTRISAIDMSIFEVENLSFHLTERGISDDWSKTIRLSAEYLQIIAVCNSERMLLCECFPFIREAHDHVAELPEPLSFDEKDLLISHDDIVTEREGLYRTSPKNKIVTRRIDGFMPHTYLYSEYLNMPTDPTLPSVVSDPIPITEYFPPLLKYDIHHWIESRLGAPMNFIASPALLNSVNKHRLLQMFTMRAQKDQAQRTATPIEMPLCNMRWFITNPYFVLSVRRDLILADSVRKLNETNAENLRKMLRVKFIGEDGVDEGGLRKEYFQLVVEEILNPNYGLFEKSPNEDYSLFKRNPLAEDMENYVMIGIIFGLALYNSVLLNIKFPRHIFKMLLGWPVTLYDYAFIDPDTAKSLWLIAMEMDRETFASMELQWQRSEVDYDVTTTVPLGDHDMNEMVDFGDRFEYVQAYLHHVCCTTISKPFECFKHGFYIVISKTLLEPLDLHPEELEALLIGMREAVNFDQIKEFCRYEDGYTSDSQTCIQFWEVVSELDVEQQHKLLWFITGSDRIPVGGSKEIRLTLGRQCGDSENLPTCHTCFNYLLVPDYRDKEKLRKKLLIALDNAQGFGLR